MPYDPEQGYQLTEPFGGQQAPPPPGLSLFPEYQQGYTPPPSGLPSYSMDNGPDVVDVGSLYNSPAPAAPPSYTPGAGAPERYGSSGSSPLDMGAPPPSQAPPMDSPSMNGLGRMGGEEQRNQLLRTNVAEGNYGERKAQIESGLAANRADLDKTTQGAQEDTRKYYDQAMNQALALSKQRTAQLQALKPTTLWSDSDGGKREALIVTMVLGGLLDAAAHNPTAPIAMNVLKTEMQAHKEQEQQRMDAALLNKNVADRDLASVRQQREEAMVDIEHKSAAQWKALQDEANAQIAAMAPGQQRDLAVKNAVTINKLADEQDQKAAQAAANLAARRVTTALEQRKLRGRTGGGPADPNDPYAGMNANQRDIAKRKDEALAVPDIEGNLAGRALSPLEGKNLRDGNEAARTLRDKIADLKDMVKTDDTWDFPGTDSAQRRSAIMVPAAAALSTLGKTGILNKEEYARYKELLSAHAWTSRDSAINGLDQLDREVVASYNRAEQSHSKPFETGPGGPSFTTGYNRDSGGVSPAPASASRPATGTRQLNNQDQDALQWANSHPTDPRAAKIKTRLGM